MTTDLRSLAVILPWPVVRRQLARLALVLIVTASAGLVWWSISHRLLPVSRQVHDASMEMASLASNVQELEMSWRGSDAEEGERRFRKAQAQLVAGDLGLAGWQRELERAAEVLGLQAATQAAKPKTRGPGQEGLMFFPVTLELRPLETAAVTNSPYARVLELTRWLECSGKRIELVDLAVHGTSNSVQQARITVNVWAPKTP
jgi:hypothetical protein